MQSDRSDQPNTADAFNPAERQDLADPRKRWTSSSRMPVFAADGQQIGTLSLASPGDYLVIQRAGDHDLYVPLSAVNRSDASGIYLALTQADLQRDEWLTPPTVR